MPLRVSRGSREDSICQCARTLLSVRRGHHNRLERCCRLGLRAHRDAGAAKDLGERDSAEFHRDPPGSTGCATGTSCTPSTGCTAGTAGTSYASNTGYASRRNCLRRASSTGGSRAAGTGTGTSVNSRYCADRGAGNRGTGASPDTGDATGVGSCLSGRANGFRACGSAGATSGDTAGTCAGPSSSDAASLNDAGSSNDAVVDAGSANPSDAGSRRNAGSICAALNGVPRTAAGNECATGAICRARSSSGTATTATGARCVRACGTTTSGTTCGTTSSADIGCVRGANGAGTHQSIPRQRSERESEAACPSPGVRHLRVLPAEARRGYSGRHIEATVQRRDQEELRGIRRSNWTRVCRLDDSLSGRAE
jgi:hypothetical protein